MDIQNLTIEKAAKEMREGTFTSVELTQAFLDMIQKKDGEVHAYLEVFSDAIAQAEEADLRRKNGENGMLLGIPVSVKDNILITGRKVSAASKILENYVAPYDATAIKSLKKEGVVFLGRVNMDEFAMGGSTENSAYGCTKNPVDITRVPGGTSGGSTASVAMYGALASIGSDTGGSIRQPASYCGVVGLKPTYGAVSRHGLMAMGSSLDVISPTAHTVSDCEILFKAMAVPLSTEGKDGYDSTSLTASEYTQVAGAHSRKTGAPLRVGIIPKLMNVGGIDPVVTENLTQSIEALKQAGCEIVEIDVPHISYSLAVYYVLMPAEVSSNMSRFDGVKFGSKIEGSDLLQDYIQTRGTLLGKEVRRRIMLGTYVLSSGYYDAYYNKANIVRARIADDFKKAFEKVDVILTPTAPTPAFKIGAHSNDPLQMYLEDVFTVPANLVGVPAISIPSGTTVSKEGVTLPLGIQFMAPHCREDILFEVGKLFESVRGK